MGCGSSQPKVSSHATAPPIDGSPGTVKRAKYKQIHSACRWNTKSIDELTVILREPDAVLCLDEGNGNTPLHIAAQNGHEEIVKLIISIGGKAVLNVQNQSGNTPLHMAVEYDYYASSKVLVDAGADVSIENFANIPARKGIEGTKNYLSMPLFLATSEEELLKSLGACENGVMDLEKSSFAGLALKLKKSLPPEVWTEECKNKFKAVLKAIPG